MSLITDALKTAGRERSGRAQSERDAQPLIDGFFPYVASSPPSRSRFLPVAAMAAVALVLVGMIGWATYKAFAQPRRESGPSIVLPPSSSAPTPAPARSTVVGKQPSPAGTLTQTPVGRAAALQTAPLPSAAAMPPRVTSPVTRVPLGSPAIMTARLDTVRAPIRDVLPQTASRASSTPVRPDYEAQATAMFNAGDLAGARERLQLATRFAPTARGWTNYGVTLQRLGDLPAAAAAYQSAIGIDANYLEAWLYQGRLAAHVGDVAKAIPMFQRARSINPRNSEVNVELSRLEFEAMNWTEARRFAEDAVRGDPASARAHWFLAVSADQLRDSDTAIREYAAYVQTIGAAERDQAQFVGYARQRLSQLRGRS